MKSPGTFNEEEQLENAPESRLIPRLPINRDTKRDLEFFVFQTRLSQPTDRSSGEILRERSNPEDVFDVLGQQEGFFGQFATEAMELVSDVDIAKLFGITGIKARTTALSPEYAARIKAFRVTATAYAAVHIPHSLKSDNLFIEEFNIFARIARFGGRIDFKGGTESMRRSKELRQEVARFMADRYIKASEGLFLHDIMHAVTNGHFKQDIAASFLKPNIQQDANPELLAEEFPTYMFNIGQQQHAIMAMLDPELARKKVTELNKIISGRNVSADKKQTAEKRRAVFQKCINKRPTFEEFVQYFFDDMYEFLLAAQLDAAEREFKRKNPNRPSAEANVQRSRTFPKYKKAFDAARKEVPQELLGYLRRIYDSKDIPRTLLDIAYEMMQPVRENLKRKGVLDQTI